MDMPELFPFLLMYWTGKMDWKQGILQHMCIPVKVRRGGADS